MSLIIQDGRLLDPTTKTDKRADIRIVDGKIVEIGEAGSINSASADEVINASGYWVTPGFIDMHARLREPGQEYKEDIRSGSLAAVAGGFTTVIVMPNTNPAVDTAEQVRFIVERGNEVGLCNILPAGAITKGREGKYLAPMGEMQKAGAVAITDMGRSVQSSNLMRSALEYSTDYRLPVMVHAEDVSLSCNGYMNEGKVSTQLGLRGMPWVAEASIVARDLCLAEFTGGSLHVCHISTANSVQLIRAAQERGIQVSADVAAHHLVLTEDAVTEFNTSTKVNPPLRTSTDQQALVNAVKDGVVAAIASDHTPQSSIEKDLSYANADFGAIGLQTALPAALALYHQHGFTPLEVIATLTSKPAKILGIESGTIELGCTADLTIIAPDEDWEFTSSENFSKSVNSPFLGKPLKGRVLKTIAKGNVVFSR